MNKEKTEQFVQKAIVVHGNKYDYSKSEYTGCDKKLMIIPNNTPRK